MSHPALHLHQPLAGPEDGGDRTPYKRMLLAFSGWMDGGDVSTGTVKRLIDQTDATFAARLDPAGYYLYHVPGDMQVAAMFRPPIKIDEGVIQSIEMPTNNLYASTEHGLLLFVGHEPHLRWESFGDAILEIARTGGVEQILFVGSFGGAVPHTREPRLYVAASNPDLRDNLKEYGARASNYEGPGSFTTYLMTRAAEEGLPMASLVAEIPGYLQGTNPMSIEAVTRRLAKILDMHLDVAKLRKASTRWELQVSAAVEKDDNLAERVRELEKQYDDELIGVKVGDDDADDEDELDDEDDD
jgi:proteasome assembly chaperone (PAC2) family protein